MSQQTPNHQTAVRGFSLVEMMVGLVVGMLTLLVVLQSLSLFEGQKRTTVTGADAQENGLMALYILERDARMAGNAMLHNDGTNSNFACTQINRWVPGAGTAPGSAVTGGNFVPISITDGGGANPDTIVLRYGTGTTGSISARLKVPVADSNPATSLVLNTATGFQPNDFVIISEPGSTKPCARLRITGIDNTTDPTVAIIAHAAGTAGSPFNPPAANNIFPTSGYAGGDEFGARVFNAGGMAENSYALNASNNLVLTDTAGTATPVADNIVNLQAQYGITAAGGGAVSCWVNATNPGTPAACDTADWANPSAANLRRIRAVRIAVVARNPLLEKDAVTPASWSLLDGTVTGTLDATQQKFRYKIYETIVPSRNLVWANM